MKNRIGVLLLCVIVSGLVVSFINFGMVCAHSTKDNIPVKISVPEFTVTFKDLSYDIPVSSSKDPYTGETITNLPYRVENRTIQVTINKKDLMKNYGAEDWLNYEIRIKGSFEDEWNRHTAGDRANLDSHLTTIILSSAQFYLDGATGDLKPCFNIPSEGKMDIQVKAKIFGPYWGENLYPISGGYSEDALLAESDWSKTQTITLNSSSGDKIPNQPSHSQDQDLTSNQVNSQSDGIITGLSLTEFSLLVVVVSLSIALVYVILLFTHRRKKSLIRHKNKLNHIFCAFSFLRSL
ncbi:MAG: hypothetical protein FWD52_01570 [Candidatus Bathyarchaeota archaeon]|nr:hypothetical protein [Candidatus Termiticorpusculum sp.]